eukprot:gene34689-44861_t
MASSSSAPATAKREFLKSKIQIGSSRGPISYLHNQTVFHHDDISEQKRLRRNEIKSFLSSKILGSEADPWSKSTKVEKPLCENRRMENFVADRSAPFQYNYRAESLDPLRINEPIDKPSKFHISTQLESTARDILAARAEDRIQAGHFMRTQEMPVNSKLQGAAEWNFSTTFERREKDRRLDTLTDKAQQWTHQITETLPAKKQYDNPLKTTIKFQEEVRRQKKAGEFTLNKHVYQRPLSPPHTRTSTAHSGVWEVGKDGRSMWSDTGSYVYESKGDITKVVNLDGYNLAGPVGGGFSSFRRKIQSG